MCSCARPAARFASRRHNDNDKSTEGERTMKTLRDTWLVFQRYFGLFIHNPTWVVVGVVQPLLYLLLFAPLLKSIAATPGFPSGGAYNVFVPGLLIQLGLFGASGVGFGLIAELRAGVIERFRVTPVSRFALLLGRALRDILTLVVQSLILLLLAIPFGLQPTVSGVFVMLGLVALIGLGMSSLSYAVTAARDVFNGHGADPDVFKGLAIMAALAVVGVMVGARRFSRAIA